jgi:hypothetical protein
MRQCPKCLHIDPPYWRHPAFFPDLDYVRLDDFEMMMPEFAAKLKDGAVYVEDELYVYKKGPRSKWVYRIWKPIFNAFNPDGTAPWSQIRKQKFYDKAGRLDKNHWGKVLKSMNINRLPKNKLDQYLRQSLVER